MEGALASREAAQNLGVGSSPGGCLATRRALVDRYFERFAADPSCVLPHRPRKDDVQSWDMYSVLLPLDRLTGEEFLVIARSFARVFPAGEVFRGDFYGAHPIVALCGRAGDAGTGARPALRALPGAAHRWISHLAGVRALHVGRIDPAWLGEGPVETNASPAIEFSAARAHSGRQLTPFTGIAWAELAARIATREEARAGVLLQAASALHGANRVGRG